MKMSRIRLAAAVFGVAVGTAAISTQPARADLQRLYIIDCGHSIGPDKSRWTPGDGGANDSGYTPENKPAEKVLREWLAKKPWEVKLN